jgi:lysozyme
MSNGTFLEGIDVSHHNGVIDWKTTLSSGISFVYMKATEGTAMKDSQFATNYAFLKNSGIPRGAYHFFHPALDPDEQSQNFLSVVATLEPGDLPPALDIEVTDGKSPATIIEGVHRWLDAVQAALGRMPVIYTRESFWDTGLGDTRGEFAQYPLWVAHYTEKPAPNIPSGFTDYTLWQYSESRTIAGVDGNVDMNRFNGALADLQSLAGL